LPLKFNWKKKKVLINMMRRALVLSVSICMLWWLSACQPQTAPIRQQFFVFGTIVDISLAQVTPEQANAALAHIAQDFQRLHRLWHAWEEGALYDLNQALATGRPYQVIEPDMLGLLRQSQQLYTQTQGLFNPTLGRLSALWGFHNDELPQDAPPSAASIAALHVLNPSMDDIHIDEHGVVTCDNPAVQLDFGAIAKGYAVDLAVAYLRQQGIEHAIVNAGGNLRAIGSAGKRPWRIGIRHPNTPGVLASLMIEGDESVFTSGNYERYRDYQGIRYSHILDPRSGWPVQNTVAVTVIAPNGSLADVASTALSVAGLEQWHSLAQRLGTHLTQQMKMRAASKNSASLKH
jgi:FAD:protein FMN transferase